MTKCRKVTIKNEHKIPINKRALCKLIRYYYKGHNNILLNFDNRTAGWGVHYYEAFAKTHYITISPLWCSCEKLNCNWTNKDFKKQYKHICLTTINDYDILYRVINTILHELKHAMQCDLNPIRFAKCTDDKHPTISNNYLKYKFSELEAEAEGWALLNLNRAFYRYERWCNERPEV